MPAGLFASLAGAACGPCGRSAPCEGPAPSCPATPPREGYLRGPHASSGCLHQRPPRPGSFHRPPLPPPALKRTQRSASRIKSHHSLRLLPASSPYCPSMLCAPFLHPAPALSPFIPPIRFPLSGHPRGGASLPALQRQKIVRSTSIFPAIPAPLCKEK